MSPDRLKWVKRLTSPVYTSSYTSEPYTDQESHMIIEARDQNGIT